jgi:CRP-like cAMP-binding protein
MMLEAAAAQYWDALDSAQFERYERKQSFVAHFAAVLTHRQAEVLGVVADECWYRGCCRLSIAGLAEEASVTRRTVYRALHVARALGLIEVEEGVVRIVSREWQAMLREQEGWR